MDMTGKTVVVTGAASGIGRATALTIAAAGGRVIVADVNSGGAEETIATGRESGFAMTFERIDLTDPASIAGFAEAVLGRGKVDVLVNAAGWDVIQPFMENAPDMWVKVTDINLLGPIRLTRALLPPMIAAASGKIVNVASDAGRVGSMGETVYAAAKGGLIAFTKSLAREMARSKINVNCVCPGPTDTPLFHQQIEKIRDALTRAIPFKRIARPEEIADAILFFASGRSDYVTGQVLSVSGGLTMVD